MTRSIAGIIFFGILIIICSSCAEPVDEEKPSEISGLVDLKFGTDSTFEIMTWNLEHFPKVGSKTIDLVARVIHYLDIDVIGLQEIEDEDDFLDLIEELNSLDSTATWIGYRAGSTTSYNQELAYVINTEWANVLQDPYEIYQSEWSAFPREPFILELTYAGQTILIINNHLKAFDSADDRDRRLEACNLLEEYINTELSDANVIVVGDMNDELIDTVDNVFQVFLGQPESFKFLDMDIAQGSNQYWSYPSWGNGSHLDHILINEPLFNESAADDSEIRTIRVDDYLDEGWSEYDLNISDHRPVAWRFSP